MISRNRMWLSVISVGVALALVLTVVLVLGDDEPPKPPPVPENDLGAAVANLTSGLSAEQDYRSPKADERRLAAAGFGALMDRAEPADLEKLGFSVRDGVDPETGRRYTIATNEPGTERAWGMYLIDRSAPPSLVIEVPHPASDLRTELFGLDYFRQVPGAVLLIAGAHRKADDGQADVAHEVDSVFHAVAATLAGRGMTQVQLHGFDDQNMPDDDIVLSSGASAAGDPVRRAADRLEAGGFAVCRAWTSSCGALEGTKNVQGKAAAEDGTAFLHVEMSRTVREAGTTGVIRALTEADLRRP
ncbi:hypothetical protein NQK81_37065 [Amycolatopsis roodepoortensis]|uniref:hypothetical protein n=1 Tax=Amycolatopsis roodepoortensis TaxID=700274 RepID=UPI00214B7AE3|nr:hypothetical protein [Amycolatopsis roodepoortensis]UUV30331.1 hypothetical protein NQK81_37065 [Amycolatopsis roodepoortensis]